ncbi:hypothetical protein HZA87_03280 [Candidatus Uhrbacteria bacterium]|nr:hypothetical protein [Candidatus Uhrbacteria bacterium]
MSERKYWYILISMIVLVAIIFALPHVVTAVRTNGEGLIRIISTDDGYYQAHVRAALLGRYGEVTNGMTGGNPAARGAAPAFFEMIAGTVFAPLGLKAPQVMMILTIFVTPLILLFLASFLFILFEDRRIALVGSGLYTLVFLSTLQKPVNMSLSLPFTILCLLLLAYIWKKQQPLTIVITGVLFGILPSTFVWSWTFVWAVTAWLIILTFFAPHIADKRRRILSLLAVLGVAFIVAAPFLKDLFLSTGDPIFAEAALRSTLVHSRSVESIPRTIILTLLILCSLVLVHRAKWKESALFPLAALLGIFACMYQNLVHGVILTFSSHYYPFVCLSGLLMMLWAWSIKFIPQRPQPRRAAAGFVLLLPLSVIGLASIFLLAGLYDYRSAWDIIRGEYYIRNIQHLAPAVQFLDDGYRSAVLTDKVSAHMVTTWTDDDVLFTAYVKHLLVSNQEYAERYCLTEIFDPSGPDLRWLGSEVTEDQNPLTIAQWQETFGDICKPVLKNPATFLKKYNVTFLLWNEKLRPEWKIDQRLFTQVKSGEGWSVWKVR